MREAYAQAYADLYRRHWWWRSREALILRTVARLVAEWNGRAEILDLGCGDGLLLPALGRFGHAVGIESDVATLADPAQSAAAGVHLGRFDSRFSPGNRWHLILLLDVIEHIEDPTPILAECVQRLHPGGRILITVPASMALWTRHDEINGHYRRYSRRSLTEALTLAGLEAARVRHFFHWLVLPKLLTAWLERLSGGRAEAKTPGLPPAWLNQLLTSLCMLEHRLGALLPIPFGSSLMAVAKPARA